MVSSWPANAILANFLKISARFCAPRDSHFAPADTAAFIAEFISDFCATLYVYQTSPLLFGSRPSTSSRSVISTPFITSGICSDFFFLTLVISLLKEL